METALNVVAVAIDYPFSQPHELELDPTYARLRREAPLARVRLPYGGQAWLATSYEATKAVMSDPRLSRAAAVGREVARMGPQVASADALVSMDPPEHTRLRSLISGTFTQRRAEQLRPRVQQLVDELLDALTPPAELVAGLCTPLPVSTICALLGVPAQDYPAFSRWTDLRPRLVDGPADLQARLRERDAYLAHLVRQRRQQPADDLISALVTARDERGQLSEQELTTVLSGLMVGGVGTIRSQLGNSIYLLLTHPEQLGTLRTDPGLLPSAVEELLRFVPLGAGSHTRIATEGLELAGATVRAGDALVYSLPSANRDETVFENPDALDLTREPNRHLTFGHGAHFCPGANLSRLLLQVALGTLLRRYPTMELAEPVTFRPAMAVRQPEQLVVRW